MKVHSLEPKTLLVLLTPFIFFFSQWGYSQEAEIAKYPTRPITFITQYAAGGSGDLAIRLLGKEAEKYLGQPIVVVTKPGGGGSIGIAAIATAKPDGYTIGQSPAGSNLAVLPFLEKLPYHPLNDIKYIMQFVHINMGVVVKAESPFKTFGDLVAYARQNPKKLTYGTLAPNSISNLIIEQIAKKERAQFIHIPFKGSGEYQTALFGDHIQFIGGEFSYSYVDAGNTRILLFFSEKHSEEYPQVPITKELGYDIPCPAFVGIAGPKGLPNEISKKLEEAFTKAIKEPAFIKGMKDLQLTTLHRSSKEFTDYVTYNYETFGKILKEMGLTK